LVGWSLDCDYLHTVFTLPHELNGVIHAHQKILYKLQFSCVSDVLNQTAEEEYGCQVGMVQVLHTWGQRLGLHVHIHVVMTAGGLSLDKTQWLPISADDQAMQREVLAAKFRKTYLRRLKTLIMQRKVVWPEADNRKRYQESSSFAATSITFSLSAWRACATKACFIHGDDRGDWPTANG
jgi:hypothetical protein